MTWFKVDDGLVGHPKVLSIPRRDRLAAMGLWTLAGSWSAANLTEGYIPKYMLSELGGTARLAAALVDNCLWHTSEKPCEACAEPARGLREARARLGQGWVFHDWTNRNPTREQVERDREAAAERQKRARQKAKERREQEAVTETSHRDGAVSHAVSHGTVTGVVTVPPTRPDPTRNKYSPPVVPSPTREPVENRGGAVENRGAIPRGTDGFNRHPHHDNAKAVCVRWAEDRKLPIGAPELLAWCYRLGNGDPWEGHRLVGRHTETELDTARNPLATVRARLRDASPTRHNNDADVIQFEEIAGRSG